MQEQIGSAEGRQHRTQQDGRKYADQAAQKGTALDAEQKIRKAIVGDGTLSTNAHNCKVDRDRTRRPDARRPRRERRREGRLEKLAADNSRCHAWSTTSNANRVNAMKNDKQDKQIAVFGLFNTRGQVEQAIDTLRNRGFSPRRHDARAPRLGPRRVKSRTRSIRRLPKARRRVQRPAASPAALSACSSGSARSRFQARTSDRGRSDRRDARRCRRRWRGRHARRLADRHGHPRVRSEELRVVPESRAARSSRSTPTTRSGRRRPARSSTRRRPRDRSEGRDRLEGRKRLALDAPLGATQRRCAIKRGDADGAGYRRRAGGDRSLVARFRYRIATASRSRRHRARTRRRALAPGPTRGT